MEALSGRVGVKCGRWNPTAEQVKVLTELFRAGLRTPSTEQIQRISTHLSAFGKVESKNVFYWFQNHKARERHHHKKKRRRGASSPSPSPSPDPDSGSGSNEEDGASHEAADLVLQPPESKREARSSYGGGGHHHRHRLVTPTCCKQQLALAAHTWTVHAHAGQEEATTWERPTTTREVETLELFPLKSYNDVDLEIEAAAEKHHQVRYVRGSAGSEHQCREFSFFDVSGGRDPPLELRLCSFGPTS